MVEWFYSKGYGRNTLFTAIKGTVGWKLKKIHSLELKLFLELLKLLCHFKLE